MWQSVMNVIAAFARYATDPHDGAAQRTIVGHVVRVAGQFTELAIDQEDWRRIPVAESFFRDFPWQGRAERFDNASPPDITIPVFSVTGGQQSLLRFGVAAVDLVKIGAPFFYVWESLRADMSQGRERALAVQCLAFADMLRNAGAPAAPASFLAACGVSTLAEMDFRLREETSAVEQIARTFTLQLTSWLDPQVALHLASVPESLSSAPAFTAERMAEGNSGGRHLPQALRLGAQVKPQGKLSILDRITLAYGDS